MSIPKEKNQASNIQTENSQNVTTQEMVKPLNAYPPGVMPGMMAPGMMPGMAPGMMPGMAPGMMPGMMGYGPQNFVYIQDPMTELAQCTGAIIRQEVEMLEVVTGCETQNRYNVFLQSNMGLKYAFNCRERSGCCGRNCCSTDCRTINIDIRHVTSAGVDPDLAKIFINAVKPCTCVCCCFCRPVMDIQLATGQYLGKIRDPCTCCDLKTEVYDKSNNFKYEIVGDCCQVGLCCGSAAEKITEIQFNILRNGQNVGIMRKLTSSMGEFFSKADSYKITFPLDATPEDKMLLICAGLLIDYENFEGNETPSKNRRGF